MKGIQHNLTESVQFSCIVSLNKHMNCTNTVTAIT